MLSCALIATLRVLRDRHAEGTTMARQRQRLDKPVDACGHRERERREIK